LNLSDGTSVKPSAWNRHIITPNIHWSENAKWNATTKRKCLVISLLCIWS